LFFFFFCFFFYGFYIKNTVKKCSRGLVLDIGCGSGQAAVALAESGAFSRVFGIDRSSAMLDGFQAAIGCVFGAFLSFF
jgi:ubiquinone/menaquinone biosynthesis C-methylase UbiE